MYGQYPPSIETIDTQIRNLEQMKANTQRNQTQPTNLTQNFQLAPQQAQNSLRIANNIDEVVKSIVFNTTPFFTSDFSCMWIKEVNGNIKTFAIQEIKPKDEKDLMIDDLQKQINELKGMINSESEQDGTNNAKSKSTVKKSSATSSTNDSTNEASTK